MGQGVNRFLTQSLGKVMIITTLVAQDAKVVGIVEGIEDDIILIRRQSNRNLVCIRKDIIATLEEAPTDIPLA